MIRMEARGAAGSRDFPISVGHDVHTALRHDALAESRHLGTLRSRAMAGKILRLGEDLQAPPATSSVIANIE